MGHQNTEMDVESLQKGGRRRGSCLDVFLVMSIIFLFVAVAAVSAGGVMVVRDLQSKLNPSPRPYEPEKLKLTGPTPSPAYKMEKFAYLEAKSSELKNGTMPLDEVRYADSVSVGSNFFFDRVQQSLKPQRVGTYFMYIELTFQCTFRCEAVVISVHVGNKLTCEVELPAITNDRLVSRKCWTVSQLDTEGLVTRMTVSKDGEMFWKLKLGSSGLGMFLVD